MARTSGNKGGGGGGLPEVAYVLEATLPTNPWLQVGVLSDVGSFVLDPPLGYTGKSGSMACPVTTYAPGADIVQFYNCNMFDLPVSTNAFTITMTIGVASLDGLNAAIAVGSVTIPAGTAAGGLSISDFVPTATAGVDLAWDGTTGTFSTTAGGVYGVVVSYVFSYAVG